VGSNKRRRKRWMKGRLHAKEPGRAKKGEKNIRDPYKTARCRKADDAGGVVS